MRNQIAGNVVGFPEASKFKFMTGYSYPVHGKLAMHCDCVEYASCRTFSHTPIDQNVSRILMCVQLLPLRGWVVIVSLGATAELLFKRDNGVIRSIKATAGSALIFESDAKHAVYHGIKSIEPNSAPTYSLLESSTRISLQFRQTLRSHAGIEAIECMFYI